MKEINSYKDLVGTINAFWFRDQAPHTLLMVGIQIVKKKKTTHQIRISCQINENGFPADVYIPINWCKYVN